MTFFVNNISGECQPRLPVRGQPAHQELTRSGAREGERQKRQMAKTGEGDARWIVSERKDGTNVNGWHWQETDVLPWAKQKIAKIYQDLDLPSLTIDHESAEVTGEAYVNTRKGKLIVGYELKVAIPFAFDQGAGESKGKIEFPYIGDENADEDAELTISMSPGSTDEAKKLAEEAKQEILSKHKSKLVGEMNAFVKVLSAGGPALESGGKPPQQQAAPASTSAKQAALAPPPSTGASAKSKPPPPPSSSSSGKTVELKEEFYCRPSDLYECYMDPGRVQAYTRSQAVIVPREGEAFSLFNGSITGTQVEIVPNERIVQDWRSSSWPKGVHSRVVITLSSPSEGRTVLRLKQTGIPEEDDYGNSNTVDVTLQGWRQQIWGRVRQCFGYGC